MAIVTSGLSRSAVLILAAAALSCRPPSNKPSAATPPPPPPPTEEPGALAKLGAIAITQQDLDLHLKEKYAGRTDEATRTKALEDLTQRARMVQAALDADLDRDPVVRAEIARILAGRFKEQSLAASQKEIAAPIPEARLRELYTAAESRFLSKEKRQVAVLWLNPKGNPERETQYREKLTQAREWLFKNGDLKDHPGQGFSVLSVDYSEHPASRFKGGILDWLEAGAGTSSDPWTKAVAEIAFSLTEQGQVSEVISRAEGVFLVRYMAHQAAAQRSFEAVRGELERAERQRLRLQAEADFDERLKAKYPVQSPASPPP